MALFHELLREHSIETAPAKLDEAIKAIDAAVQDLIHNRDRFSTLSELSRVSGMLEGLKWGLTAAKPKAE